MDPTVARLVEPAASTETPTPVTREREYFTPEPAVEMPLEVYEAENGSKYIQKLFEVDDLMPQDMVVAVASVDEYITQQMSEKGYNPTTEAYRACLEGMKKELGIDKYTSLETTIDRLGKYVEAERLLKSLHSEIEAKILKQLKKSHTKDFISLVMAEVEKKGL